MITILPIPFKGSTSSWFDGKLYRYGFQGQETDDEVRGKGNSVNYKYRMHDARIGRFFAVDPLAPIYPHYSPYSFSGNRVIDAVELEGLEPLPYMEVKFVSGGKPMLGTEGLHTTQFGVGFLVYHEGTIFTKPGWYKKIDYNFITVPGSDYANPSLSVMWSIGSPDWGSDGDISTVAGVFSTNIHLSKNEDGTTRNAYRHFLWQAMITSEHGSEQAQRAGYYHEDNQNADLLLREQVFEKKFEQLFEADEVIDLMNNRLGREYISSLDNSEKMTAREIAFATLEYFRNEGLYIAVGDEESGYKIQLYKLTEAEYKAALENLNRTDENGFNEKDEGLYNER